MISLQSVITLGDVCLYIFMYNHGSKIFNKENLVVHSPFEEFHQQADIEQASKDEEETVP